MSSRDQILNALHQTFHNPDEGTWAGHGIGAALCTACRTVADIVGPPVLHDPASIGEPHQARYRLWVKEPHDDEPWVTNWFSTPEETKAALRKYRESFTPQTRWRILRQTALPAEVIERGVD